MTHSELLPVVRIITDEDDSRLASVEVDGIEFAPFLNSVDLKMEAGEVPQLHMNIIPTSILFESRARVTIELSPFAYESFQKWLKEELQSKKSVERRAAELKELLHQGTAEISTSPDIELKEEIDYNEKAK